MPFHQVALERFTYRKIYDFLLAIALGLMAQLAAQLTAKFAAVRFINVKVEK